MIRTEYSTGSQSRREKYRYMEYFGSVFHSVNLYIQSKRGEILDLDTLIKK